MDKNDWVVPLITGIVGVVGGLGGAVIAGHYQERAALQQAQVELTKLSAADKTAGIKELKDAAARYLSEHDAFLNAVVLSPKKEKLLVDHLTKVQTAGAVLIVLADEELARYTNSVNAYSAQLLSGGNQPPIGQRLSQLATIRAEWMKQLRRSLDTLKKQNEDNLKIHADGLSTTTAMLKG